MVKQVELTKGYIALVDDEDYKEISKYIWHVSGEKDRPYACRTVRENGVKKTIRMHRQIALVEDTETIDHINHDTLDNRKTNLRACKKKENCRNISVGKNNTSGFTGVYFREKQNKWDVSIMVDGKGIHLGRFDKKEDAIKAREDAEIKYFKEFRNTQTIAEKFRPNMKSSISELKKKERIATNNKSGVTGVSFNKRNKKWCARYKGKHLGWFIDRYDAVRARKKGILDTNKKNKQ